MLGAAAVSPSAAPDNNRAYAHSSYGKPVPDPEMTEHPEITFRDGPTGPRAALVGGPDVWEVIQTVDSYPGGKATVTATAELLNLSEQQVQAAIDYRATNPDEIAARIKLNARTPVDEPEMAPLPANWGETLTGEPMPNVVAAVHRSRGGG